MTDEEFHDQEIAPGLLDLAKKCEARGMPFVAYVQYDESGNLSRTRIIPESAEFPIRLIEATARACTGVGINVDGLIMSIMHHAREHGHSSICLSRLGVPEKPEGTPHD